MRFEKLNYNSGSKKRIFLYGLIVGVLLIVIMNLFLTKAKYQVTDTKKLASGTINYNPYDFKIMAMYTKDEERNENTNRYNARKWIYHYSKRQN